MVATHDEDWWNPDSGETTFEDEFSDCARIAACALLPVVLDTVSPPPNVSLIVCPSVNALAVVVSEHYVLDVVSFR